MPDSDNTAALLKEWGDRAEKDLNESVGEGEYNSLRRLLACIAALESTLTEADRPNWGTGVPPIVIRRAVAAALADEAQ